MGLEAFLPQGNTSLIIASTTATAARQLSDGGHQGVRVALQGSTQHVFLAFGQTTATAALPTTGTAATGMPVHPNSAAIFSCPPGFWISAITSSGTANVFVTPGYGL